MAQNPSYYALSYSWGSQERPYSISIGGWNFPIGENLHSALLSLRSQINGESLSLWVDAICIDQVCTRERNHQVGIMGQIYSKCKEVFVWLGETSLSGVTAWGDVAAPEMNDNSHHFSGDTTDYSMWTEYLSSFEFTYKDERMEEGLGKIVAAPSDLSGPTMTLHCAWFLRKLADGCHLTDLPPFSSIAFEDSQYFVEFEMKMTHLRNHEWFNRLWVVQEAVLGPSVRIFFGLVSLPLQVLTKAMETFHIHTPRRCCLSSGHGHYNLRSIVRGFLQNFIPIVQYRRRLNVAESSTTFLLPLCLDFLERQASVDVDRVYALLGLLTCDEVERIAPDYSQSPSEVYAKVSSDYIQRTSSLLPLFFAGLKNRYPKLPSWVIDWTIFEQDNAEQHLVWNMILPLFRPSTFLPMPHIEVQCAALVTQGLEFDTVATLGTIMDQSTKAAFRNSIKEWKDLILLKYRPDDSYVSGSTWNDAWLRTLSADCCWGANSARRINSEDIDFFSKNLDFEHLYLLLDEYNKHASTRVDNFFQLTSGEMVPSDAHFNDIWGMVQNVTQNKRLFVTERGYLGLGNSEVSSGDTIFTSPSSPAPLLLRRQDYDDIEPPQQSLRYRMISGCYVHGIMDVGFDEPQRSENEFCKWKLLTIL